jgi:DNA repair ATPase RecN
MYTNKNYTTTISSYKEFEEELNEAINSLKPMTEKEADMIEYLADYLDLFDLQGEEEEELESEVTALKQKVTELENRLKNLEALHEDVKVEPAKKAEVDYSFCNFMDKTHPSKNRKIIIGTNIGSSTYSGMAEVKISESVNYTQDYIDEMVKTQKWVKL